MSKKIAIITGASSGLGREFVRLLDADSEGAGAGEFHLDALWIIARRKERLEELAAGLRTDTDVIALDLTDKTSVTQLQEKLSAERPDVRMLINAAGSGKIAASAALPLEQVDQMIDLNCRAAVDVTQICLPYMDSGAKIMEICSTAAFQPIPYLNVYAASKAFLYRYSRALRFELRPRDITVTAVCPYWIKDTEFISSARQTGSADTARSDAHSPIRSFPFASTSETVAEKALMDTRLGLSVSTPGFVCTVHRAAAKLLSSDILMYIFDWLRKI